MEEDPPSTILDGNITGISFSLATRQEICKSSISDCPISHASQFSNPFLGLPLEVGKCESCGTAEPGQCEGHFGYIELPIPIYHPDHVGELKRLLDLICLKCLQLKNRKIPAKNIGTLEKVLSCCEETSQVKICEVRTTDGACYLELKLPKKSALDRCWNFLERYGFRYSDSYSRPLLPSEVYAILRRLPLATRRILSAKGHPPQDGYVLHYLPVPPNCLSVPDVSDGNSIMSSDYSLTLLKKVLKQVEIIKSSRSGTPNFESHVVEANDLQAAVALYFQFRGTGKAARDVDPRFGVSKEQNESSTKAWSEKMKTLFIRKGSGFSSRSVITGDPYKGVGEIGLPFEIAQRITFEERVSQHNMEFLQKLVDEKLCLTYKDGSSTYSLSEGSKGYTFLRPGQVVHRKIMDGDVVFINRPPTTHKHSLQALSVYVHDDHVVKINPLICGPLSADFDGDCVHIFYPQSLAAKAEVIELFSVEKQLLSSHTGNFNLQLATDSLLSLKLMFKCYFFGRAKTQQLVMFGPQILPEPALVKSGSSDSLWTVLQILKTALPSSLDCSGERHQIRRSEILSVDYNRDILPSILNDVVTSIQFGKGPKEVLKFFNCLQPLLMENLFSQGFSISLGDFFIPKTIRENIQRNLQNYTPLLVDLRSKYNGSTKLQLESLLRGQKLPVTNFVLKSSAVGLLIDSKSESALNKVVEQIGFLGLQISDKGKFYSSSLVDEMATLFRRKYPSTDSYPSEQFGLVRSCLFDGLDPYQEMVHAISSREVIVRSSRGLTEPGTLFKNLMAILRDVVICYDGTVRNVCSNSIVQFEYGYKDGSTFHNEFGAGDPVGVLAATAMSNPAYKAVLDSSPSSNSSWEMMKEILLCAVKPKNDILDRRVTLYLNDCDCGRKYCQERAAYLVKNQLRKVSLKDAAVEFLIEYRGRQQTMNEIPAFEGGLVGHIHLNKRQLDDSEISMHDVLEKCQGTVVSFGKKKKVGQLFKRVVLSSREYCSFRETSCTQSCDMHCLNFSFQGGNGEPLERTCTILADSVCPVLLETIIKGDPRVSTASIMWIGPETSTLIRSPENQKGELVVDVVLEKEAVKQNGDAWRVIMDCCLPVIHVIDTTRSVPYGIKQIQELLGISCAFEQAVQRLASSVTMVTKGVLKDHLVLLANSMTCPGTMIGFNNAGIKAFSRALNIQAPFREATLFTARKSFERAAEKCHKDSLSSIIASCSWGKHVAVGTGSPFDIHLDTRKIDLNEKDGIDVYNFLHLVRSSSNDEGMDTACLGQDIDDIEIEDDSSPVRDTDFEKADFEDGADFEDKKLDDSTVGGWDLIGNGSSGTDAWNPVKVSKDEDQSASWSSWGKMHEEDKVTVIGANQSSKWDKIVNKDVDQSAPLGSWGRKHEEDEVQVGDGAQQSSNWDNAKPFHVGEKKDFSDSNWSSRQNKTPTGDDWEALSAGKDSDQSRSSWGKKPEKVGSKADDHCNAWNSGNKVSFGLAKISPNDTLKAPNCSYRQNEITMAGNQDALDAGKGSDQKRSRSSWGSTEETGAKVDAEHESLSSWEEKVGDSGSLSSWEKKVGDSGSRAFGSDNSLIGEMSNNNSWKAPETGSWPSLEKKVGDTRSWPSWGKKVYDGGHMSGSQSERSEASPNDWGKFAANDSERESPVQKWGSNARGWTSSGDRRDNRRNRPARPADFSAAPRSFTATRHRLDAFTEEEQKILSDIEPIMQNIRRIMHQTGYNDGDPLAAEDQSYIIENVFNHHPDKAVKMGAGIDFIMVSRHVNFQESRCFYVVSPDGGKQDFSYRKSLDNFIKLKYPDKAEAFLAKYFRKRQPQPDWNKDRGPSSGWKKDSGSPRGWNKEPVTPSGWNKESGSPKGWNKDPKTPEELNKEPCTPSSWNKKAGSPSGWKNEHDPLSGSSGWNEKPSSPSGWNKNPDTPSGTPGWNDKPSSPSGWNKNTNTPSGTSSWNKGPAAGEN